jgi:hypothetical protein
MMQKAIAIAGILAVLAVFAVTPFIMAHDAQAFFGRGFGFHRGFGFGGFRGGFGPGWGWGGGGWGGGGCCGNRKRFH